MPDDKDMSLKGRTTVSVSSAGSLTTGTHSKRLLQVAEGLIERNEFNVAIVISHMAAEIASERAFDQAFRDKNLDAVGTAIGSIGKGYNLASDSVRELFIALTGKQIQYEPFWSRFKVASAKRNKIVHRGELATKQEAEEALTGATGVVKYLDQYEK